MKLESVVQYVDQYLGVADHPDYPTALNGLQVEGPADVAKIATAVDASEASIGSAVEMGADLLVVHHGLFWEGLRPLTGRHYRRVSAMIRGGVGLYGCHLPLDAHPEIGNSAVLARGLGLELSGRFGPYNGSEIGWWGTLPEPTDAQDLVSRLQAMLGGDVRALPGGPERIQRVGVVTGGGGAFIPDAADLGLDAFVTGEGSHHHYFDAVELGIHVLLGGHYATETFGVKALGEHLAERFGLKVTFIDQPTGL